MIPVCSFLIKNDKDPLERQGKKVEKQTKGEKEDIPLARGRNGEATRQAGSRPEL